MKRILLTLFSLLLLAPATADEGMCDMLGRSFGDL